MKYRKKLAALVVSLALLAQCLGMSIAAAEEITAMDQTLAEYEEQAHNVLESGNQSVANAEMGQPVKVPVSFGTTVRGGSYADQTASIGDKNVPRENLEAKWAAGEAGKAYTRRSHLELNPPESLAWQDAKSIKLVMYLADHTGNGKKDIIQVFKTEKPAISEENWTWNNTLPLMDDAEVIGEQQFTNKEIGSWIEIDITDLKSKLQEEETFALALFPKAIDDQGGIKFYSQHQEQGKYAPYVNVYMNEYIDVLPPSISTSGISDKMSVIDKEFTFTINSSDNYDADPQILLSVNGQSVNGHTGSNTVVLRGGNNTITIQARDAAGNTSAVLMYQVTYNKSDIYKVVGDTYIDIQKKNNNLNGSTEKGGMQLKNPVSNSTTRDLLLSYDLSDLELPYVKQAAIELFLYERMGTDQTSEVVNIYATEPFDETTVTWNTAPEVIEKAIDASYDRSKNGSYVSLDITPYLNKKLAAGSELGMVYFRLTIEQGHDQKGGHFASKEMFPDKASRLVITEGLPSPELIVTGIEDDLVVTEESLDITAIAKSVSESVSIQVSAEVNGVDHTIPAGGQFTVSLQPGANIITIKAVDEQENAVEQTYHIRRLQSLPSGIYYIDSIAGADDNDGLSEQSPWKSLDYLNNILFEPGSRILFKRGSVWNGQFRPNGSGTAEAPIIVDAYGSGDSRPVINGNGVSNVSTGNYYTEGAVHLVDLSYWEINRLEVTNQGDTMASASRAGIIVLAAGKGYVQHVYIRDVYVHDVNSGDDAQKISGGIIYRADTVTENGTPTGVASGFRDVLVENSHIKDVAIEGLRTKTHKDGNDTGAIRNYDVVFRNNLIENILGDGIVISEMESGGIVEKNIVRRHSMYPKSRNYAGLWLYQTNQVIVQYNEVYDGVWGYNDGEAFDFDIGSTNNIYQYNYSHNNRGGFLLTMTSAGKGNIFRYNISQNDGRGTEIFFCMNDKTAIYNNTIYIGEGIATKFLVNENRIDHMYFKNNIVHADGEIEKFSNQANIATAPNITNNLFYPKAIASLSGSPKNMAATVFENPMLVSPDAENIVTNSWDRAIWSQNIANFKLQKGSPAIDAGAVIENAGKHDMFGMPLYAGDAPDIGAHEYTPDYVKVDGISLQNETMTMQAGDTAQLEAVITPANATIKQVEWVSSDPAIVAVSDSGLVKAVRAGKAVIHAVAFDGGLASMVEITVEEEEDVVLPPGPNPNPLPPIEKPDVTVDQLAKEVTSTIKANMSSSSNEYVVVTVQNGSMEAAIAAAKAEADKLENGAQIAIRIIADPELVNDGRTIELLLNGADVQKLAESDIYQLVFENVHGQVKFDRQMLAELAKNTATKLQLIMAGKVVAQGGESENALGLPIGVNVLKAIELQLLMDGEKQNEFASPLQINMPYELKSGLNPYAVVVYQIDENGTSTVIPRSIYNLEHSHVEFDANGSSSFVIVYDPIGFSDVNSKAWYYNAVTFAAAHQITKGKGEGLFAPNATLTRAEFLVMAMRAYGISPNSSSTENFADAGNSYYTDYLAAAKQLGLAYGSGENNFAPEKAISREEQITLLYRIVKFANALPIAKTDRTAANFRDADQVSDWAEEAMNYMIEAGVVNGNGTYINPTAHATRAHMVQLVLKLSTIK